MEQLDSWFVYSVREFAEVTKTNPNTLYKAAKEKGFYQAKANSIYNIKCWFILVGRTLMVKSRQRWPMVNNLTPEERNTEELKLNPTFCQLTGYREEK